MIKVQANVVACGAIPDDGIVEVLLVPDGRTRNANGVEWIIDDEAWRLIESAFRNHGVAVPIDVAHESLKQDKVAPKELLGAVGWVEELLYEKGRGIIGKVAWNDEGKNRIRSGRFRYLSPTLHIREDDMMAVELHSVGLVNKPAIPHMERMAAEESVSEKKEKRMDELKLIRNALGAAETDPVETLVSKIGETKKKADAAAGTLKAVCNELGLSESAGAEAISAKLKVMKEATANSDKSATRLAEVEKQLTDIRVGKLHAMLEEKVRVNAINAKDPSYEALKKLAVSDPENFTVIVNGLKPIVEPGRTAPPEGAAKKGGEAKEREMIANAVKDHKGNYADGLEALQRELMVPHEEMGLTRKAARQRCEKEYPVIFGAAA